MSGVMQPLLPINPADELTDDTVLDFTPPSAAANPAPAPHQLVTLADHGKVAAPHHVVEAIKPMPHSEVLRHSCQPAPIPAECADSGGPGKPKGPPKPSHNLQRRPSWPDLKVYGTSTVTPVGLAGSTLVPLRSVQHHHRPLQDKPPNVPHTARVGGRKRQRESPAPLTIPAPDVGHQDKRSVSSPVAAEIEPLPPDPPVSHSKDPRGAHSPSEAWPALEQPQNPGTGTGSIGSASGQNCQAANRSTTILSYFPRNGGQSAMECSPSPTGGGSDVENTDTPHVRAGVCKAAAASRPTTSGAHGSRGLTRKPSLTHPGSRVTATPVPSAATAQQVQTGAGAPVGDQGEGGAEPDMASTVQELRRKLEQAEQISAAFAKELEKRNRAEAQLQGALESLQEQLEAKHREAQDLKEQHDDFQCRAASELERLIRQVCEGEAREAQRRLALDCLRVGRILPKAPGQMGRVPGHSFADLNVWRNGDAWRALEVKQADIMRRKDELERMRRQVAKEIKDARKAAREAAQTAQTAQEASPALPEPSAESMAAPAPMVMDVEEALPGQHGFLKPSPPVEDPLDLELLQAEETVRLHMNQLKRDEARVEDERRELEGEKAAHIKALKLAGLEENSPYRSRPVLNGRYLFMSMLGKGGFSEVWKAFDLQDVREVAVKIHHANCQWSEERRELYVRHTSREYKLHRDMEHPRVAKLYACFEIDCNSFATVLELCRGGDLDQRLKAYKTFPEKEARGILIQILTGLKYLSSPHGNEGNKRPGIIHYDLKPANILFDDHGDVKITDFGLSKVLDDAGGGTSMELTSQGAGTYWYLPPECFKIGQAPPRISSKVDVWSCGVILFEMLFGGRPFGQGKDQQALVAEKTMLQATLVTFPPKPLVSPEAKEFIRSCLTHSMADRPDVPTICKHPYLRHKKA